MAVDHTTKKSHRSEMQVFSINISLDVSLGLSLILSLSLSQCRHETIRVLEY